MPSPTLAIDSEQVAQPPIEKRLRLETQVKAKLHAWQLRLGDFDNLTNGRLRIFFTLAPRLVEKPIFGLGTGGAGRYLRDIDFSTKEAHNEYLRMMVDHGLIGTFLLLTIACVILKRLWGTFFLIVAFGVGILLLTDNYFIYPSFGYGPLIVAMGVFGSQTKKNAK